MNTSIPTKYYDHEGPLELPKPRDFVPPKDDPEGEFYLQHLFPGTQVIIKIINVELTPEKPQYNGEEWHIETAGTLTATQQEQQRIINFGPERPHLRNCHMLL